MPGVALPNWLRHLDEEVDNRLIVRLRDGRTFIGTLRSYDQYGNLLFESACERYCGPSEEPHVVCYADVYLGCVVVRGENIVLFGRMKTESDVGAVSAESSGGLRLVECPLDEVFRLLERNADQKRPTRGAVLSSDADYLNDDPFL